MSPLPAYHSFQQVITKEIKALEKLKDNLDAAEFQLASNVIYCAGGTIHLVGVGKSGHVARKVAATMASLGLRAHYLDALDALHGDLGVVGDGPAGDVVILFSNSGRPQELVQIALEANRRGAKTIAITAGDTSALAQVCALKIILPRVTEACALGLAPTASVMVQLAVGDALAIAATNISERDFATNHPGGALGAALNN